MSLRTIHRHHAHCGDHSIAKVPHVAPGESVEFEVSDGNGGQITPPPSHHRGMPGTEAFMPCGVRGDLRISEVDPIVPSYFPRAVFA